LGAVDADAAPDLGVYLQPIHLTAARERIQHKVYLRTIGYPSERFDACRETAGQNGWDVQDISCTHDMMIDEPQRLAHILTTSPRHHAPPDLRELGQLANLRK
jgi:hypothetical protein